jgi:DNA-binding HxlR family transcriptional regulator
MDRGYGQYCPVAKGAEVFAERWTPLIIRNLHLGCRSFGEIHRGVPRMSRSLLSHRLATLERDGIVERRQSPSGRGWQWYLTPAGQELSDVCLALGTWAARWMALGPRDHDPGMVLWAWCRLIDSERLPERRVVVRFDLRDQPKDRFWLVLDRPDAEVCVTHPGFDEDLIVVTDSRTLTLVHMGRVPLAQAIEDGGWDAQGPPELARALMTWGGLSPYADVAPACAEQVSTGPASTWRDL